MESQKTLPGAWQLIRESWTMYRSHWNAAIRTSLPLLYLGVAYFMLGILLQWQPVFGLFFSFSLAVFGWILTYWVQIRTTTNMLEIDAGKPGVSILPKTMESDEAWRLFFSYLWISILAGLAIFGGYILLILPGIYLSIALGFSKIIRIDQGTKGKKALGASLALVKGRWWSTFWRRFAFGLLIMGVSIVLIIIIALITGAGVYLKTIATQSTFVDPQSLKATAQGLSGLFQNYPPIANGIIQFIEMLILALALPFMLGFEVKLYRALKDNR